MTHLLSTRQNTHNNSYPTIIPLTHIQFTAKTPDQNGSPPFLDTIASQAPSGTLITMVYRKPTHRDQQLHWDSHHSITNQYNIYNILSHRAQFVCSNQQLLDQENQHIHMALSRCNYHGWVLHRLQTKVD